MSIEKLKQEILETLRNIKEKVKEAEEKGETKVKVAHISEIKRSDIPKPIHCDVCGWIYTETTDNPKKSFLPGIEYVAVDKEGKTYYICSIECLEKLLKKKGKLEISLASNYLELFFKEL